MIKIFPAPLSPDRAERAKSAHLAPGPLSLSALPPLTLYVHFPWCVRKCPYCDFNSHEHRDEAGALPEAEYLSALVSDLQAALPLVWGRRFHAVFLGGGTPSLFSVAAIDELIAQVRALVPLEPDAEITLEANPGTSEARKFRGYRNAGVTRLSIGVQSFNPRALQALGRIHDDQEARRAVEFAQQSFENVNLDLMYALPGQTQAQAEDDLKTALAYAPAHVSLYHLTLEANTVFAKHPPVLPDDESAADMQDALEAQLRAAGYEHYEISAHAREGRRSRHNLNYWNFGDYLGIGAGAHSKLSFANRILRQVRYRQPQSYLGHAAAGASLVAEEHEIKAQDLPFEFMLNALRLTDGIPSARFSERTGLALTAILPTLEKAEQRGLLKRDHARIWPTEQGVRFLNDLQEMFLAS
ncbi:MAG: radical SAM family heme chaperone HemW [Burkholderiaceae bacterium]